MNPRIKKLFGWWSCSAKIGGHIVIGSGDTPAEAYHRFHTCAVARGLFVKE